jgi:bidirectional [NiFe] hydrogenase diaphorase subunit
MVLEDLIRIKEAELARRKKHTFRCCLAAGCVSSQGPQVKAALEQAVKEAGLEDEVEVRGVGCLRLCCEGPLVVQDPEGILFQRVRPEDAASIVGTLKGGQTHVARGDLHSPFFKHQLAIVLENSGVVDPERIESYIAHDGYLALRNVLREMTPADVIAAITKSGLRGRGGAGYPTGLKWATVAKTKSTRKYVVCNADEGDPGAFMDRSVLEGDPHRVIEGMIIAGYAIGASRATSTCAPSTRWPSATQDTPSSRPAVRAAGQPASSVRLQLRHRPAHGRRRLRLRRGDGADGLDRGAARRAPAAAALPGRKRPVGQSPRCSTTSRPLPTSRPIILNGPEWFAGIGTEKSKGTKVFALAGQVNNTGLIEVPMGTPLRRSSRRSAAARPDGGKDQGRADRRPVRRLHPGRAPGHAGGLRVAWPSSARSWAPAA